MIVKTNYNLMILQFNHGKVLATRSFRNKNTINVVNMHFPGPKR